MESYFPVLVFAAIATGIAVAMLAAPLAISWLRGDKTDATAYECGFEAFDTARRTFDVRFYLVAILFIVFDLEVAFLFPWSMALEAIGWEGFMSMMIFLGVLTIGFIYEWKSGALEWE